MKDRRAVRWPLMFGVPIELMFEDGTDRSVGEGADLDGARGGIFETCDAKSSHQPEDATTRSEALFGMRSLLQDQLTESRRCRADHSRVPADAIDSPVSVAAMTGRHVV